ncbi:hypothetical protein [Streptomyces sp. NPDC059649]|uniref:hypothetical protein n=1 Tax=Streptomyces sp. NPDC059649 TaxID=3346895 RepID=UPI003687DDE5
MLLNLVGQHLGFGAGGGVESAGLDEHRDVVVDERASGVVGGALGTGTGGACVAGCQVHPQVDVGAARVQTFGHGTGAGGSGVRGREVPAAGGRRCGDYTVHISEMFRLVRGTGHILDVQKTREPPSSWSRRRGRCVC